MKILLHSIAATVLLALSVSPSVAGDAGKEWHRLNQEVMSLYGQGNYEQAVVVAKKALTVAEKKVGKNHPDVAGSLNNLAEVYRAQGEYPQAETHYQRALAIYEKTLGPENPDTTMIMHKLVLAYLSQCKCRSSIADTILPAGAAVFQCY